MAIQGIHFLLSNKVYGIVHLLIKEKRVPWFIIERHMLFHNRAMESPAPYLSGSDKNDVTEMDSPAQKKVRRDRLRTKLLDRAMESTPKKK